MSAVTYPPGLHLFREALAPETCQELVRQTVALHHTLTDLMRDAPTQSTHIPQPEFVTSQAHNLTTQEQFVRLRVPEEDQRLRCEFFPEYGSKGHALAYFRGTRHLPGFVHPHVTRLLHAALQEAGVAEAQQAPQWRLTVNTYSRAGDTVSGFPFHVDIPANGAVTSILNVHHLARFEIVQRDGDTPVQVELGVGDILVLSGPSRYDWKHRVLPMQSAGEDGTIARVSLVLGLGSAKGA